MMANTELEMTKKSAPAKEPDEYGCVCVTWSKIIHSFLGVNHLMYERQVVYDRSLESASCHQNKLGQYIIIPDCKH